MKKAICLLMLLSMMSLTANAYQDTENKTEVIEDSPINLFLDNVYAKWNELKDLHQINGDDYKNLETIIRVQTLSGIDINQYDYDSITVLKSSGSMRFDDIALLSVIHTKPTKYIKKLSASELDDYREIHIMFGVGN